MWVVALPSAIMLIFSTFAAENPLAGAPAELDLSKNLFHFGRLLNFQQFEAHVIKTKGAACYAYSMPLSCPQTLLSFASAHNSDVGAQAKVLLLHGLAIIIFGCVYSCLAVKMHDHPHRDCHQTVTLIQTQAGWCLCEQLSAALCASSICLSSQCLLVAADHCNLANEYTYSADGGSCHEASPNLRLEFFCFGSEQPWLGAPAAVSADSLRRSSFGSRSSSCHMDKSCIVPCLISSSLTSITKTWMS